MTEQDNFGRLTQAMALLGDTLAPFVERELKRAGQGWWTNSVLPNVSPLTRQKLPSLPKKGVNGQLGVLDVADLLSLITKNFSVAFRNRLPDSARSYAEELRPAADYFDEVPTSKPDKEMVDLAIQLIGKKSAPFKPDQYKDHYQVALKELVQNKLKGNKVIAHEEQRPAGTNVVDLMEALKRSSSQPGDKGSAAPAKEGKEAAKPKSPKGKKSA